MHTQMIKFHLSTFTLFLPTHRLTTHKHAQTHQQSPHHYPEVLFGGNTLFHTRGAEMSLESRRTGNKEEACVRGKKNTLLIGHNYILYFMATFFVCKYILYKTKTTLKNIRIIVTVLRMFHLRMAFTKHILYSIL